MICCIEKRPTAERFLTKILISTWLRSMLRKSMLQTFWMVEKKLRTCCIDERPTALKSHKAEILKQYESTTKSYYRWKNKNPRISMIKRFLLNSLNKVCLMGRKATNGLMMS